MTKELKKQELRLRYLKALETQLKKGSITKKEYKKELKFIKQ